MLPIIYLVAKSNMIFEGRFISTMTTRFAAHEFLETQECLRSICANIELHSLFSTMCQDQTLKQMLNGHIQQMMNSYNQGVNLLQGKGMNVTVQPPTFRTMYQPTVGLHNPTMTPPNPNTSRLSDASISTIILNQHKNGSMIAMFRANECVDPQIRMYHVNGANQCQQMAYEMWQWMNHQGYYQTPQLADHTMNTMMQAYQTQQPPMMMNNMNNMNMMKQ
jgi:spore coat protein CotF